MSEDVKQTFCRRCHGMTRLSVGGKTVPPLEWTRHGLSADMGCLCPPRPKKAARPKPEKGGSR